MPRLAASASLIRICLLFLLAVGAFVRPVLNQAVNLHEVEHAISVAAEHGHYHQGDEDHLPDPDHATGSHGVFHQPDSNGAFALWNTWTFLPSATPVVDVPELDLAPHRSSLPTSPFRPPIA